MNAPQNSFLTKEKFEELKEELEALKSETEEVSETTESEVVNETENTVAA